MTSGTAHFIFRGYVGASTDVVQVEFRRNGANYELRAGGRNDASAYTYTPWTVITDAAHAVELDWQAGTAAGANNGGLTLWIDGTQVGALSGVDNDTRRVDRARIGAVGLAAGTTGTFYLDAFESRRESAIGPVQVAGSALTTTAITYGYDPLYRLTSASYSDGTLFGYQYDAVGNVLTKTQTISGTPTLQTYAYDDANRQTSAAGLAQTYDNNGNLLNDGTTAYTWDGANRMTASGSTAYTYNGLNDRVSAGGVTHQLDLNTGLTQVLADGTNTYLYGAGRLGEQQGVAWQYHLADGLGSVRQLADASGAVSAAKSYEPYGEVLSSAGTASSAYGFTGEQQDPSGKLVYLRARYYQAEAMRFASRDTWTADVSRPRSYNRWGYSLSNPVNYTDPTGLCPTCLVFFFPGVGATGSNEVLDLTANEKAFLDALRRQTGATITTIYPYGPGAIDPDYVRPADGVREDEVTQKLRWWGRNLIQSTGRSSFVIGDLAFQKAVEVAQLASTCGLNSNSEAKKPRTVDFLAYSGGGQIAYATAQALTGLIPIRKLVTLGAPLSLFRGNGNVKQITRIALQGDWADDAGSYVAFGLNRPFQLASAGWSDYQAGIRVSKSGVYNNCTMYDDGSGFHHSYFDAQTTEFRYIGCEGNTTSTKTKQASAMSYMDGLVEYLVKKVGLGLP